MNNKLKIFVIICSLAIIIGYNFFEKKKDNEYEYYLDNIVEDTKVENISNLDENASKIKVYIIGEVQSPGVVELEYGARIEDAIIQAGGTTNKSDLSRLNLAFLLEDGVKIIVPSVDDVLQEQEDQYEENYNGGLNQDSGKNSKININTAQANELENLPGVGASLAEKIVKFREENGKFKNIEDLKNVSGIGERKFESLKDYIKI